MQKCGMSEKEIADVLESDERIDHGEKLFELPEELQEGARKARLMGHKNPVAKAKRERKENEDKRFLLTVFANAVRNEADKPLEIANPEREFSFEYNGQKYKVVLSCPRK